MQWKRPLAKDSGNNSQVELWEALTSRPLGAILVLVAFVGRLHREGTQELSGHIDKEPNGAMRRVEGAISYHL